MLSQLSLSCVRAGLKNISAYEVQGVITDYEMGGVCLHRLLCYKPNIFTHMLKEELEKQLGFKVSDAIYDFANEMYLSGNWRNNNEFCGELKQNALLMRVLMERDWALNALGEIVTKVNKIIHTLKLRTE